MAHVKQDREKWREFMDWKMHDDDLKAEDIDILIKFAKENKVNTNIIVKQVQRYYPDFYTDKELKQLIEKID